MTFPQITQMVFFVWICVNLRHLRANPKFEIRNDMMTGSCIEPSQNVILSEAGGRVEWIPRLASLARDDKWARAEIPNSEFRILL